MSFQSVNLKIIPEALGIEEIIFIYHHIQHTANQVQANILCIQTWTNTIIAQIMLNLTELTETNNLLLRKALCSTNNYSIFEHFITFSKLYPLFLAGFLC